VQRVTKVACRHFRAIETACERRPRIDSLMMGQQRVTTTGTQRRSKKLGKMLNSICFQIECAIDQGFAPRADFPGAKQGTDLRADDPVHWASIRSPPPQR